MLERIKEQNPEYGMKVLQWILLSRQPLTIEELQYALAIKPSHEDLNPEEDLLQWTQWLV